MTDRDSSQDRLPTPSEVFGKRAQPRAADTIPSLEVTGVSITAGPEVVARLDNTTVLGETGLRATSSLPVNPDQKVLSDERPASPEEILTHLLAGEVSYRHHDRYAGRRIIGSEYVTDDGRVQLAAHLNARFRSERRLQDVTVSEAGKEDRSSQMRKAYYALGALDDEGRVTAIGLEMEKLGFLGPRSARMVVEARKIEDEHTRYLAIVMAAVNSAGRIETRKHTRKNPRPEDLSQRSDLVRELLTYLEASKMTPDQMRSAGISGAVCRRVRDLVHQALGTERVDMCVDAPNADQIGSLVRCAAAGMMDMLCKVSSSEESGSDKVYGLTGPDNTLLYRIDYGSSQNRMPQAGTWVVGVSRQFAYVKKGGFFDTVSAKAVLTDVTVVTPEMVMDIAPQMVSYDDEALTRAADNTVHVITQPKVHGLKLGDRIRRPAVPGELVRNFVIDSVIKEVLSTEQGRAVHREMIDLRNRGGDVIPKIEDVLRPSIAEMIPDDALRVPDLQGIMSRIVLAVPQEIRDQVEAYSPKSFNELPVKYDNGTVSINPPRLYAYIENVYGVPHRLPDGREVLVHFGGKAVSIDTARAMIDQNFASIVESAAKTARGTSDEFLLRLYGPRIANAVKMKWAEEINA